MPEEKNKKKSDAKSDSDKDVGEKKEKREEKKQLPKIRPGMTVRVHQKIKDIDAKGKEKERVQIFEGMVLAHRHGKEPGSTITVRKIAAGGIGVEKIFPLHSPAIIKIEPIKQAKVRRAKLYYLRKYKKKLKEIKL
jgi:large subunit ribosomal protein L19